MPKQEIDRPTDLRWPDDKRTALTQSCYEKSCEVAERYGLTLLLVNFILQEGSTILMGTAEVIKNHLEKMNKEDDNAQISKH